MIVILHVPTLLKIYANSFIKFKFENFFFSFFFFLKLIFFHSIKQSFPPEFPFHPLALESLLSILKAISNRITEGSKNLSDFVSPYRSQKQFKTQVQKAVDSFNKDPAEGLKVLQGYFIFIIFL